MRMSYLRYIWGACLVSALPVAVGQAEHAETLQEQCARLVDNAREIDRLLRTVSDRESGQKVAEQLSPRLEYMHATMENLGSFPLDSAEALRLLERTMHDLMHITQGFMPVLQRLNEVNAYGAEELIALFKYYKVDVKQPLAAELREETPLVRHYGEWCDSLDDVLYLLRKIDSGDAALLHLPALVPAIEKAENRAAQVERLQSGLSPQQLVSERVPAERLRRVGDELRAEIRRLRDAGSYGQPALNAALLRCAAQIRG